MFTKINLQRTAHSAQRTAHSAQRTAHKNLTLLNVMIAIAFMAMTSCKKDVTLSEANITPIATINSKTVTKIRVADDGTQIPRSFSNDRTRTVLGKRRDNPFTTKNMAIAHNKVRGTSYRLMPATHRYFKLMPKSPEQMILIANSTIEVFDYPLEYEVLEMGDYYFESTSAQPFPELYVVLPADEVPPAGVANQLIDDLHLDYKDVVMLKYAFYITGNTDEPEVMFEPEPTQNPVITDPPPAVVNSTCNCTLPAEENKPGGCVTVEESFSGFNSADRLAPVKNVKVIVKDNWFKVEDTFTNDNGCWSIDKKFKGTVTVFTKFKNADCMVRGAHIDTGDYAEFLLPIKHKVQVFKNEPINNISITYSLWTALHSQTHRFWAAANAINAVSEMKTELATENIGSLPNDLDIYVTTGQRVGFALMAKHISPTTIGSAVGAGVASMSIFDDEFDNIWLGLRVFAAASVVSSLFPDVMIGADFTRTDIFKNLAYHELTHTSHFNKVGDLYWWGVIAAEVAANGHGDRNSTGAGIIAIAESWAEHVALGTTSKNYIGGDIDWSDRHERMRNESNRHIPIGIYKDLVDANTNVEAVEDEDGGNSGTLTDNVRGFTNPQMFDALDITTLSVGDFQQKLINGHLSSTPNTTQQVNDLFNQYQ